MTKVGKIVYTDYYISAKQKAMVLSFCNINFQRRIRLRAKFVFEFPDMNPVE